MCVKSRIQSVEGLSVSRICKCDTSNRTGSINETFDEALKSKLWICVKFGSSWSKGRGTECVPDSLHYTTNLNTKCALLCKCMRRKNTAAVFLTYRYESVISFPCHLSLTVGKRYLQKFLIGGPANDLRPQRQK
ncbi:hypothetical protein AVEN_217308-1 [Araneus ventricosus]|uniref:Uncharacterized protein n=1 Tax=Araneus ventricosus TaxID=182803 RepID=A0A4Y2UT64_ARAVE|nr:hypothetical protein AVEN_217308-1 [Araneus ventricosus]